MREILRVLPLCRDRQWFLEIIFLEHILDRKRFKNEFFTIKNRILKKNRIKNEFFYQKIDFPEGVKCP